MKTVAVIQARLGSTRLPGKVMFPLDVSPVLSKIIDRLKPSTVVDEVVVATTEQPQDDVIIRLAEERGVATHRGSESDVLKRLYEAAEIHNADTVVRVCSDTPFVSYRIIDVCIQKLIESDHDYVSTKLQRTFPVGYGAEAFTIESFRQVETASTESNEREHVTVQYREDGTKYSRMNISSDAFFKDEQYQNRGELRLTLDRPADYHLIKSVYQNIGVADPSIESVIDYIDGNGLAHLNNQVEQESMCTTE